KQKENAGDPAVIDVFVRALTGKDEGGDRVAHMVRRSGHIHKVAADGLRQLGAKTAVPALADRVADDVWYISGYSNVPSDPEAGGKAAALAALKELAPDKVKEALERAAKSKDEHVRKWAADQLKGLKDQPE